MDSSSAIMAASSISDPQLTLSIEKELDSYLYSFPTEFPYEFDSFLPVDSESSDEDDFAVGLAPTLTHQLALDPKKETESSSPKSILSGIGSWSMSSHGSRNGGMSPPTTPPGDGNDTMEPVCAGTGDVLRLNQNTSFYLDQMLVFGDYRLKNRDQVNQLYSVWGRQQMKAVPNHLPQNQIHSRGNSRYVRPLGLPQSAWPPLQVQQNKHRSASSSSSVFAAGSGAKRACAGTGVFLPRRFDELTHYHNKSDCSPVLFPAKVKDCKINGAFASKQDASMTAKNGQQKGDLQLENAVQYELCLPQEWIY